MRNILAFSVLAALLVASVAVAKPDLTAEITQLGASGISGSAAINVMGNGQVKVHEQLTGLEPGVTYVSRVYAGSSSCGAAPSIAVLATFTANAAGKANINVVAPAQINPGPGSDFSVSVETAGAVVACGQIQ